MSKIFHRNVKIYVLHKKWKFFVKPSKTVLLRLYHKSANCKIAQVWKLGDREKNGYTVFPSQSIFFYLSCPLSLLIVFFYWLSYSFYFSWLYCFLHLMCVIICTNMIVNCPPQSLPSQPWLLHCWLQLLFLLTSSLYLTWKILMGLSR